MGRRATASYLILSTPRSGSNLLCRGLESTNLAGKPREYFNPSSKFWTQHGEGADPAAYVDRLLAERATPNGVFGAKVSWRHMRHFERVCRVLPRYARTALPDILAALFPNPRYLRITRHDKLRQAISFWKAYQTGVWGIGAAKDREPTGPPEFDYDGITKILNMLVNHEAGIDEFFAGGEVAPLTVVYEALVDAYEETVRAVLDDLGIGLPADFVIDGPRMARQADAETEAWVERYHQVKREQGEIARVSDPVP